MNVALKAKESLPASALFPVPYVSADLVHTLALIRARTDPSSDLQMEFPDPLALTLTPPTFRRFDVSQWRYDPHADRRRSLQAQQAALANQRPIIRPFHEKTFGWPICI